MGELIRMVNQGPAASLGRPDRPVRDAESLGQLWGHGALADHMDRVGLGIDLGCVPERGWVEERENGMGEKNGGK